MDIYGLKNCDTCRKVRKELDGAHVDYTFHDVREEGVSKAQIQRWAKQVGWATMLNKSSTTWRGLPDAAKQNVGEAEAVKLMAEHPALIKRPIISRGDTEVYVGWTKDVAAAVKG